MFLENMAITNYNAFKIIHNFSYHRTQKAYKIKNNTGQIRFLKDKRKIKQHLLVCDIIPPMITTVNI